MRNNDRPRITAALRREGQLKKQGQQEEVEKKGAEMEEHEEQE